MGRAVRRVPANWAHPKDESGNYIPLYDGSRFEPSASEWDSNSEKWARGEFPDYADSADKKLSFVEWDGERPNPENYMPAWTDQERTHYMMYEDTTEGTPISPAFETPEELARWLVDNGASAFGRSKGSYEGWLRVANGGFAPSMIIAGGVIQSGVEAL